MKSKIGLFSLVIVVLCTLLFHSCKKHNDDNPIIPAVCTDFIYKDYVPDTIIHMPNNYTTTLFALNINNDSLPDINFYLDRYPENSGPHVYDACQIVANGKDSLEFIARAVPFYNRSLDSGQYICDTNHAYFAMNLEWSSSIQYIYYFPFTEKGFIGFRIRKHGNYYFGWLRVQVVSDDLIIDDYALSNCPNMGICMGQH